MRKFGLLLVCLLAFSSSPSFAGSATIHVKEIVIDVRDQGQIYVLGTNGVTYDFQWMSKNHSDVWPYVYGLLTTAKTKNMFVKFLYEDVSGLRSVEYVNLQEVLP